MANIGKIVQVIGPVLDVKFDSEKSKLNLAKVNVKNLIMNVVYNNQGKALEKNINIECDLESIDSYLDKDKISRLLLTGF